MTSLYANGEEIKQNWNGAFVAFAYAIAFVSAYSSVSLLDHNLWRHEEEKKHAIIERPIMVASVMLGFGSVWCMHFVGMAAVSLEQTPICYDWPLTFVSLAAALVFTFAGLKVASYDIFAGPDRVKSLKQILINRNDVTDKKNSKSAIRIIFMTAFFHKLHFILAGSVLAATGALVMHYTGMMALKGPFRKEWSIPYIATSAVIAIVVCFAGFWIIFRLRWKMKQFWLRYLSAAVVALAICGLHFFGMLCVTYYADDRSTDTCSKLVSKSESSPNAWTTHQVIVVAICLVVPSIALFVENILNRELLLLVYSNLEDPDFSNMFGQGTIDLLRMQSNSSALSIGCRNKPRPQTSKLSRKCTSETNSQSAKISDGLKPVVESDDDEEHGDEEEGCRRSCDLDALAGQFEDCLVDNKNNSGDELGEPPGTPSKVLVSADGDTPWNSSVSQSCNVSRRVATSEPRSFLARAG